LLTPVATSPWTRCNVTWLTQHPTRHLPKVEFSLEYMGPLVTPA